MMWHLTLHKWVGEQRSTIENALGDNSLQKHLAWMREQQYAGKVLIAGPSEDYTLGIIVFGHMSRDAVDDLCRGEPLVAAGHREFEVIPWDVHHLLGIGEFELKAPERR